MMKIHLSSNNNYPSAIIMMVTYNGEQYLRDQLDSIINQSFINWVMIISDDGSDDSTLAILDEYKEADNRIVEICRNNNSRGAYSNYFSLMKHVKEVYDNCFDYYFYCDQDDIWFPNKMEKSIETITTARIKNILCYSDVEFIDKDGLEKGIKASDIRKMESHNKYDFLFEFKYLLGTSMAHDRALWDIIRIPDNVDPNLRHDQYIRKYAALTGDIIYIPEVMLKYRRHSNNISKELRNYRLIDATIKLFTEFPLIMKHTYIHMLNTNIFLRNIDDINQAVVDYRNAIQKKGIWYLKFIKKYNIIVSDNKYESTLYSLLILTGVYKLAKNSYKY